MEQRLVGTWRNTTNPAVFTFHSDGTMSAPGFSDGVWYIEKDKLYSPDSHIQEAFKSTFEFVTLGRKNDTSSVLTFQGDNKISVFTPINGGTCIWQRVPEESEANDSPHNKAVNRSTYSRDN